MSMHTDPALRLATRLATQADAQTILQFDESARAQRERVNFIYRTVASRHCHVVTAAGQTIGYGVLEYNFFDHGFISTLYVRQDQRRRGAASALLTHLERICKTPRIFTALAADNAVGEALLRGQDYSPTGTLEHVDEQGTLKVYFKSLR